MRKTISRCLTLSLPTALLLALLPPDVPAQTQQQIASLNQLRQAEPSIKIRWNKKTGTPSRLYGRLSTRMEGTPREICQKFFQTNRQLFGMANPNQELAFIAARRDPRGWQHARLQQRYNSVPVEGNSMLVHINRNREVQIVKGTYQPDISLDTTPGVQPAAALEAARKHLDPKGQIQPPEPPEVVIYEFQDQLYLAWKCRIVCPDPLGDFIYYVDAQTGAVIDNYNNLKFIMSRRTHDAQNTTSLPGLLKRAEGMPATGDAALDAAHENAGQVYRYYKNRHGRDSYDNAGAAIVSTVHFQRNFNNAFWNSSQMVYGDGDGNIFAPLSQSLDVVAHELTHAVTERESNLIYRNQSGALNESISDIFGVLIDSDDWQLGEDVFTPGTPGDALRYVDDPPRGRQPDHMDDFVDTVGDNGGVHINSGIPNKAAYLMAAGGTHHGISVVGMGRENMARVWYETQINWLVSNADFLDAREATIDAVRVIFPGDRQKENTVRAAWAAVGVGPLTDFTLEVTPNTVRVGSGGDTDRITAVVKDEGNPVSGATVTFSIGNPSRGSISPAYGSTGPDGRVVATVTGESRGNTEIITTATSGNNTASRTTPMEVPVTSAAGLLLMLAGIAAAMWFLLRRASRAREAG